jgi:hypothetical protein
MHSSLAYLPSMVPVPGTGSLPERRSRMNELQKYEYIQRTSQACKLYWSNKDLHV